MGTFPYNPLLALFYGRVPGRLTGQKARLVLLAADGE